MTRSAMSFCVFCSHGEEEMTYRGNNCRYRHKIGETWVPYGSTSVKLSDDFECVLGYDASVCDCPPDVPRPADHRQRGRGWSRAIAEGVD